MLSLPDLFYAVIQFAQQNRPLTGLLVLFAVGTLLDLLSTDRPRLAAILLERRTRVQAYSAALILSYIVDWVFQGIASSSDLGWIYSTHVLVQYFLVIREAAFLVNYIGNHGVEIPFLKARLAQLSKLDGGDENVEEIRRLMAELRTLRESRAMEPPQSDRPPDSKSNKQTI